MIDHGASLANGVLEVFLAFVAALSLWLVACFLVFFAGCYGASVYIQRCLRRR